MYALNNNLGIGIGSIVTVTASRLIRRIKNIMRLGLMSEINIPQHTGSLATLGFFASVAIYGLACSGNGEQTLKLLTSNVGFAIENVDVSGNHRLSTIDVLSALSLDGQTSMIGFSADNARARLEALPWIKSADVQKIYPNHIHVSIVERQPYAVWQHDNLLDIIDNMGRVIVPFTSGSAENLPLVVGSGAESSAADFITKMAALPSIYQHIYAYVRVGDRRWDIILDNGVRIKLPATNAIERLKDILSSKETADVLQRDIIGVDLRLNDRVTVELPAEAMARREAVVKDLVNKQKAREANRT